METKTSQFLNHPYAGAAPSLDITPDRNIAPYLEPVSNIDSISHEFVSHEYRPRGLVALESEPRGTVALVPKPCAMGGLTDEKLYELCKKFGAAALHWRQKFIGLLPEVNKRRLFEKKGFGSIFEFAKKLAGLSEEQVRRVLSLEKKFEEMPSLHAALVNGEVSVSKLAKVASIATSENSEVLSMQVKLLPRSALETLVRDQKCTESVPGNTKIQQLLQNATGRDMFKNECELKLSPEVIQKLLELQNKGIDINKLILGFLEKRELEIAQEKEEIAKNVEPTNSHYIPACVREILKKENGTKCSIPTCAKPATIIHHTQRFGLSQNHDPRFLAPLCREHHAIAHTIDIKYQQARRQMIN